MNKPSFIFTIKSLVVRYLSYLDFKLRHHGVKIINPLKVGTFYSQDGQDLFLSSLLFKYLNKNSDSWVVDIGCNHPSHFSNSLAFEKWFGCRVLAIDPIEEFSAMWAKERPSALFLATAIGCSSDPVVLRVPQGELADNMFSTVTGGINKAMDVEFLERTVTCLKLADILFEHDIKDILLMSIDVEGVELDVLKSVDFEKVMVRCICLENNSANIYGSNNVRDYLTQKGYIFFARIGFLDDVFIHGSMINGQ